MIWVWHWCHGWLPGEAWQRFVGHGQECPYPICVQWTNPPHPHSPSSCKQREATSMAHKLDQSQILQWVWSDTFVRHLSSHLPTKEEKEWRKIWGKQNKQVPHFSFCRLDFREDSERRWHEKDTHSFASKLKPPGARPPWNMCQT